MPAPLNTYISNMCFGLAVFYSISTLVGYLMPNPVCTYISNIYMICKHILLVTFSNQVQPFFFFFFFFFFCVHS